MSCACAKVCMSLFALHTLACDCFCTDLHSFLHVCQHVFACPLLRLKVYENMRPSFLTSKMLAHSAVWGYTLTGCLWWTTIYNNVKLTHSSRCSAGRRFNMTHPEACFVRPSFVLVRAVCRLIIVQLYISAQWDALLLTSNSQCFTEDHFSGADACICLDFQSKTLCVHACSKFILWNLVKTKLQNALGSCLL